MTIGPNNTFEHEVIHLPFDTMKKTQGIELVTLPRAMNPSCFCLGNFPTELNLSSFMNIGT